MDDGPEPGDQRPGEPDPQGPRQEEASPRRRALEAVAILVLAGLATGSFFVFRGSGSTAPASPPSPSASAPVVPSTTASGQRRVSGHTLKARREPGWKPADRAKIRRLKKLLSPQAQQRPTSFTVSSFNLLGFSHTAPGGNRKGWAGGRARMHGAVAKLAEHRVSVAGLQEFQVPQYRTLRHLTGSEYGVYPGARGRGISVQNSIIWRTSDWALARAHLVPIPYFHGHRVPMPYVLLVNRHTGRKVWFANYHNPADVRGPAGRYRATATRIEARLFRRLTADGTPLVVTGDMNERGSYACRLTARIRLHSANGAYRDSAGCHLPRRQYVDWIFGSPQVRFTSFTADRDRLIRRTTDHPMMVARVEIPPDQPGQS